MLCLPHKRAASRYIGTHLIRWLKFRSAAPGNASASKRTAFTALSGSWLVWHCSWIKNHGTFLAREIKQQFLNNLSTRCSIHSMASWRHYSTVSHCWPCCKQPCRRITHYSNPYTLATEHNESDWTFASTTKPQTLSVETKQLLQLQLK